MLELKNVTKKYSVFPVVKQLNFSVKPSEVVGGKASSYSREDTERKNYGIDRSF